MKYRKHMIYCTDIMKKRQNILHSGRDFGFFRMASLALAIFFAAMNLLHPLLHVCSWCDEDGCCMESYSAETSSGFTFLNDLDSRREIFSDDDSCCPFCSAMQICIYCEEREYTSSSETPLNIHMSKEYQHQEKLLPMLLEARPPPAC